VRGVINLRGNVLPVVDMRQKFGMGRTEKRSETRVIVIEVTVDDEPTLLGALADAVRDVIDLDTSELKPPPKIGTRLRTEFIRGVGRKDDDFVLILDIGQVFSLEELTQFNEWDHADQAAEPAAAAEGEPGAPAVATAPESADAAPGAV
jgi:purine-binding chemotaxis protein CheW